MGLKFYFWWASCVYDPKWLKNTKILRNKLRLFPNFYVNYFQEILCLMCHIFCWKIKFVREFPTFIYFHIDIWLAAYSYDYILDYESSQKPTPMCILTKLIFHSRWRSFITKSFTIDVQYLIMREFGSWIDKFLREWDKNPII